LATDTEFLSASGHFDHPEPPADPILPMSGVYPVRRDRCVVELSARLLGHPWLRGRLKVREAVLTVGLGEDDHQLTLEFGASSLWTTIPRLAGMLSTKEALCVTEFPDITFTSTEVCLFADSSAEITGQVEVTDIARDLRLTGDLRHVEDEMVILWASGVLPPPRRRPAHVGRIAGFLARRRIHVEIAAEFRR
jgi:polyisoprenoid-binding protein YceI